MSIKKMSAAMREKIKYAKEAINRINDRYRQIKKAVDRGEIPYEARDQYERAMRAMFSRDTYKKYTTESGFISRSTASAKYLRDKIIDMEKHQTVSEIKAAMKKQVEMLRDAGEDYTESQYIDDYNFVRKAQSDNKDETYEAYKAQWGGERGITITYQAMRQAIEEYRAADDEGRDVNKIIDAQSLIFAGY